MGDAVVATVEAGAAGVAASFADETAFDLDSVRGHGAEAVVDGVVSEVAEIVG